MFAFHAEKRPKRQSETFSGTWEKNKQKALHYQLNGSMRNHVITEPSDAVYKTNKRGARIYFHYFK